MVSRGFRRLREVARSIGWAKAIGLAPRWAFRQRYLLLTRDLGRPLPDVGPSPLRFEVCSESDLPLLTRLDPRLTEAEIRARWSDGQECYLGFLDAVPVHYRWYATRSTRLPGPDIFFHAIDGDYIVVEIFTDPRLRRRGVHASAGVWALERARRQGKRRAVAAVASWNVPSLNLAHRMGYDVVGTLATWSLGRARRYSAGGAVRLTSETPPAIRLV